MNKVKIRFRKQFSTEDKSNNYLIDVYEYIFSLILNEGGKNESQENSGS